MAIIGPTYPPEFYVRHKQKLLTLNDDDRGPLNTLDFTLNHAIPLLRSDDGIPVFGLGTWQSKAGEVGAAVKEAIKQGYRHIDCAQAYGNQKEVAEAIHDCIDEGIVTREDLWITTKIWNTFHSYDAALEAIKACLKEMRLDYFDLVLIHWPMGYEEGGEFFPWTDETKSAMKFSDVDYIDTYQALVFAQENGLTRHIGLSNFEVNQVLRITGAGLPMPQVIQVEIHVYLKQFKMMEYCQDENIALIAYSPLASTGSPFRKPSDPSVFTDKVITAIASSKEGVTNAQVALRWLLNRGIGVIPKSSKAERIAENAKALHVILTDAEMKKLDKLNKDKRFVDLKARDGHHMHFPWKK
uniref:Aldo_ket_red domain-containing protein n=1 Tax=Panagrellus redivivus TaxID=6233 RepID=A0A7E4UVU4_PANRE